ncbi:TrmH family RNA methyltransferase [Sediminitomix flava]|uniref:tRNA (Guanosine-2'-O-)-methyltransferase n=1 Tax=Sediminitomix flava TaxID=379075 RepID=A0A315Z5A8_SEDFL|nr:TrmH family RNA methyltransferase [Sediminitomix flava]PWJ38648.1 tRNA (guanosine-2'-O-)-methyltransferase [Sediminitomix flava]
MGENSKDNKSSLRIKADKVKDLRCKNLIAVLEEPTDFKNIGKVVRTINALGVEKLYVVDSKKRLPEEWEGMRSRKSLLNTSVSAIKWTFVKTFESTDKCLEHLEKNRYISIVTSPHVKGKKNLYLQDGNYTQKRLAVWFGNESVCPRISS